MVDIFSSGIENQFMEITKLKVQCNDKLPHSICQNCRQEMDYIVKFLEKAKGSDTYLRSILSKEESTKTDVKTMGQQPRSKIVSRKAKKKVKDISENNKLYLIVVSKGEANSEEENGICVKDLNVDNDDFELAHYCKTLVKNYFSDHTYPKEYNSCNGVENMNQSIALNGSTNEPHVNYVHNVNLFIYKCIECKECFDEYCDLTHHYLLVHNGELPEIDFSFMCPLCKSSIVAKSSFLAHLECHKKDGFKFVNVNSSGEAVQVKEHETEVFEALKIETMQCNKVWQLCVDTFQCGTCFQRINPEDIEHHAKSHTFDDLHVKFACPICDNSFDNNINTFFEHLLLHREQNNYFIKVSSCGEPLELHENETFFVPHKEAVDIINIMNTDSQFEKVIKVTNINSCHICEYSTESFGVLCSHYEMYHPKDKVPEETYICPVCTKDFKTDDLSKSKQNLYEHLKIHKNAGLHFIEINRNGTIAANNENYSSIFTQSKLLLNLLYNSLFFSADQIWCPCLVLPTEMNELLESEECLNKNQSNKNSQQVKGISHNSLSYICEKCGKKFSSVIAYKKHFTKHSQGSNTSCGKRPICTICNKNFANKTSLYRHVRNHIKEGVVSEMETSELLGIICEKCGRTFSNLTSLTKHKKSHRTGKENTALKCDICGREFYRQSSFDRHKSAHLNPKYFDCNVCKLPLPSVVSLQKHLEMHKTSSNTHDCKACKTSFLTKESLTAHQTHTGHYLDRKPMECNVCHEKFFIGRKFTEHIKMHPKYKMGECTLCGKRLSTVQSLMLHMGRHFESNSILCPHCGKQFFEERNYHRHLLTHEGIKPFACDVDGCEKSFYTLFELNRHKKYHNNTRDFVCPYCSKSFHEANHLTVHVRTHTGERPYVCPHCNKGFITRTRCKHHIKLVHQGIGYDLIQSSISKKVAVFEAIETAV
ncbi:hypothetical protein RUM44_012920 [Polyplax serrata]|uniref:Uncharacterized protein n=1 Tax=Polyplax serrata TaxID=468196 RepID=A0ABR1BGD5_POLSC